MKSQPADEKGAVLIFAVLLLAAGVFVLTGIAQLAATQALVGQREWEAVTQRVTLENSRAMARQFMLARMFSNVVSTNSFGYTTNWGGFSISNISGPSTGLYWDAASTNAGQTVNPFNPMERGGFYPGVARARLVSEVTATNTNTNNAVNWDFLVRTRSPIAAGYSFVQQGPTVRNFEVVATRFYATNGFTGFADIPQTPVSSVTNTNVDNANVDPVGYGGYFAVPLSPLDPEDFSNTNEFRSIGDPENPTGLEAVVNLGDEQLPLVGVGGSGVTLRYDVPSAVNYVAPSGVPKPVDVIRLVLQGAENGNALPPLQIVATNNSKITNVVFSNNNPRDEGRQVYLHYRSALSDLLTFTFTNATAAWRIGVSVRGTNTTVDLDALETANVFLVGGIRTDGEVLPSEGAPVAAESDPQGLDFIADQMMWLEDYRVP